MAGRNRTFPCGHQGKGQHCHRCEQEERARQERQAARGSADEQPRGVPNLHEALAQAARLGCDVSTVRRTGEVLVSHALGRARINNRRKDAPRVLLTLLARIEQNGSS